MGEILTPILYDLHDPGVIADPYPTYAWMRQRDPVWHNPASGSWVVTRYTDVQRVLLSSERRTVALMNCLRAFPVKQIFPLNRSSRY